MEHRISNSADDRIQPVVWEPRLSMRVEKLDAQHQKLFAITNTLIEMHEKGSGDLMDVLSELVQYTSDHFRDESLLMFETRYPDLEKQKQEHDQFIEKMMAFVRSYSEGKEELTHDMLNYCRNWLYLHTGNDDLKFAEYLVKKGLEYKYWKR